MEQRDFLGDEVHMMQNDIKALRTENELLKMKNERQDETLTTMRSDVARLRAAYEDKVAETAALQSILENAGQVIHSGIDRYLKRRDLKRETRQLVEPEKKFESGGAVRTPVEKQPIVGEGSDPSPAFLRRPITDHPLLPRVDASDDDILRELANDINARNGR